MRRRRFLAWGTTLLLGYGFGLRSANAFEPRVPTDLTDLDIDPAAAAAVGRHYLRTVPAENDRGLLLERLGGSASLTKARIADLVEADFGDGRTVLIDGWVMSRSEARVCALYALGGEPRHV